MSEPVLNDDQVAYLRSLEDNPMWVSVVNAVASYSALPSYRPGGDPSVQHDKWVYESGRMEGFNAVISLLTNGKRGVSRD